MAGAGDWLLWAVVFCLFLLYVVVSDSKLCDVIIHSSIASLLFLRWHTLFHANVANCNILCSVCSIHGNRMACDAVTSATGQEKTWRAATASAEGGMRLAPADSMQLSALMQRCSLAAAVLVPGIPL